MSDQDPDGTAHESLAEAPGEVLVAEGPSVRAKAKKAPSAFRTISEVADELHIPQHVLRFWETKFPQVKPLKRGGGRRYYRPDDITLLRRISDLLYIQGYTIKGVQRLLREGGGKLSDNIPPPTPEEREAALADANDPGEPMLPMPGLSTPAPPRRPKIEARAAPSTTSVQDPEIARLRSLLVEVLAELEAIRDTLR
jgi:DNA-binding transcriptional MerR regulator